MRRVAGLLLLAAACIIHREPEPTPDEGAWARVRDANTRSAKLYDELAVRAFVTAT